MTHEIDVPAVAQDALKAKHSFAKQTQDMYKDARSSFVSFVEGIAATCQVPNGYTIDIDNMKFVPAPEQDADTEALPDEPAD
jgi:hypothetical protein